MSDTEDIRPLMRIVTAFGGTDRRRLLTAARAGVLAGATFDISRRGWQAATQHVAYSVTVAGGDPSFGALAEFVTDQIPSRRRRSLSVESDGLRSTDGTPARLLVRYDGIRPAIVRIGGYPVRVHAEERGNTAPADTGGGLDLDSLVTNRRLLRFSCATVAARDAVLDLIRQIDTDRRKTSKVFVAGRWGWDQVPTVPRRDLSTIVLADGLMARLTADLDKFLASEDVYSRLGIPWHHGLMFEGPPGTGKSATAQALALSRGLDVYYLPLSDLKADSDLHKLVSDVGGGCLIIEDVDTARVARDRDDTPGAVSLSGVLNVLDGAVSPHGSVLVMTTNRPDAVDQALIRPGRVDFRAHFGYLTNDQFAGLWRVMVDDVWDDRPPVASLHLTPADVLSVVKPHLGSPGSARAAFMRYLDSLEVAV